MSFVVRQPNGLLCRFSTIVDCPIGWNLTDDQYIEICAEQSREEAKRRISEKEVPLMPFSAVIDYFVPENMTMYKFKKFLDEVGYKK